MSAPTESVVRPRARYERFREKQFVCDYCDHGFTLKQNVQTHIFNYHLGKHCFDQKRHVKRFECTQCLKVFRTLLQATRHELRAHRKPPPKIVHACNQCHKTYKTPSQLREHYTIAHLNERPFECDECGARFGRAGGLRRHKIFVHTDRTFDCPYEGCTHPGYKCSKALAAHIRSVHTKDRPYVCETCSKAFVRRNDLKMHEQTHIADRTFPCPACFRTFKRPYYLKKHLRTCQGAPPVLPPLSLAMPPARPPPLSLTMPPARPPSPPPKPIIYFTGSAKKRKASDELWAERPAFSNELLFKSVPGYSDDVVSAEQTISLLDDITFFMR